MTLLTAAGIILWFVLTAGSAVVWWLAERTPRVVFAPQSRVIALLAVELVGTAVAAALIAFGGAPVGAWRWPAVGVAGLAAVLTGAVVTLAVLTLSDASASPTAGATRTVLRGGAWIGALERLGLLGSLLAGSAEGIVAIIAIKSLARYPELKTGQSSGASERFIIGTFTSLGWAAVCAGIGSLLIA